MHYRSDIVLPFTMLLIMVLCDLILAQNASLPVGDQSRGGSITQGQGSRPSRSVDNQDLDHIEDDPSAQLDPDYNSDVPEGNPITYAFIEAIVQHTVNKYMRLIRTKRNWLERLLQLVREEREIRSRYNCSTDSCIYKIQLFTHLLTTGQPTHASMFHPRVRRSVEDPPPITPTDADEEESISTVSTAATTTPEVIAIHTDESKSFSTNIQTVEDVSREPKPNMIPIQDDALRLQPDSSEVNNSPKDSKPSKDGMNALLENGSSHPKTNNFGIADKINMERMSKEVLSEALSRENKAKASEAIELDAVNMKHMDDFNDVPTSTTTSMDLEDASIETLSTILNSATYDEELWQTTSSELDQPQELHTTTGSTTTASTTTVKMTILTKSTTPQPDLNLPHLITDGEIPLSFRNDTLETLVAELTTIPLESASTTPIPKRVDTIKRAPRLSSMTVEPTISAIPFGLNQFAGKPYENCTGRFQNYCYNALKCVYIGVLETAVCYCRTGYTGVRCDMFNLAQTLDILKSFREDMIDVPSLNQPYATTLYSGVEATARYTVNAVLKNEPLYSWDDEVIIP